MKTSGTTLLHRATKKRKTNCLLSLLVGVCFFMIPAISRAQTVTPTVTSVTCFGGSDGEISILVEGYSGTIEYSYDGTIGGSSISGLPAGDVVVNVTENALNIYSNTLTITQPASVAPITDVTFSGQNWSCASPCNGTLVVTIAGGTAPYDIFADAVDDLNNKTATDEASPYTFTGLCADTYTITVTDACGIISTPSNYLVSPTTALSLTVLGTSKNWTCTLPCSGEIDIAVTGGGVPYNITADALVVANNRTANGVTSPYSFSNLCADKYSLSVTDVCGVVATTDDFLISEDLTAPTCDAPERKLFFTPADFGSFTQRIDTFYSELNKINTGDGLNDTLTYTFDASNHNNIKLKIEATQSSGNVWLGTDFLEVRVSYNGGSWNRFLIDYCGWSATTDGSGQSGPCDGTTILKGNDPWFDLNNTDGNIQVQVICSSDNSRTYNNSLYVKGNSIYRSIATTGPTTCIDNNMPPPPTISLPANEPIDWFCNAPGNMEFKFDRKWTVTDFCGNPHPYTQTIAVGTAPEFVTQPRDTTLDFCHYLNVDIPLPTGTDNCDTDPLIQWNLIRNKDNIQSGWTNGSFEDHNFIQPDDVGETYTLWWKFTDDAGFADSLDQIVTFLPEIELALLVTPTPYEICEGSNATFQIQGTGGTGGYQISSISPAPVQTLPISFSNGTDATFTYNTTDHQISAGSSIAITYQDINFGSPTVVGGCPASGGNITFTSGVDGFTVHEKIVTNPLNRD